MSTAGSVETRPPWLDIVREQVGTMRFGVIQIVVHEGQVVQIERTERVRLPARISKTPPASASPFAEG